MPGCLACASRRKALSVVRNAQFELPGTCAEPDGDAPGLAVFDRVGDGFLGNAVKVRGHDAALHCHRPFAGEAAPDLEAVAGGFRQFFQGRRQPLRANRTGKRPRDNWRDSVIAWSRNRRYSPGRS